MPERKIIDTREKTDEDSLVREVRERMDQVNTDTEHNRSEGLDDLYMINGMNYWPQKTLQERQDDGRPCLTIPKLAGFVDQVLGDSRINKISIKVRPYGGGATPETAQTFNGLIRSIERASSADVAYQTAQDGAANNGFGYFRIVTGYIDDDVFDQEIRIQPIKNAFSVYMDTRTKEPDGRDARFCIITEMIDRKEFKERWPNKDPMNISGAGIGDSNAISWSEEGTVRIAEYWVKRPKKKTIHLLSDGRVVADEKWEKIEDDLRAKERTVHLAPGPDGQPVETEGPAPEGSGFPEQILDQAPTIEKTRTVDSHVVVQYLVDGAQILEGPTEFPSKYIPIVCVKGKELDIDGKSYLRGVIRFAKDSARMHSYFRSAATEVVALAPKAPYIGAEGQFEGHPEWDDANSRTYAKLEYKPTSVAGQLAPPPQRQVMSQSAIGEITESNISTEEMKETTGIFDASRGAAGPETSGIAIQRRDTQSRVSNIVYHDNLRRAVAYAGDILIDMIPRVYDTFRQVVILNEDDSEEFIAVNETIIDQDTNQPVILNDLTQGKYKVMADTGPTSMTQRIEAVEGLANLITNVRDPLVSGVLMAKIVKNMDWSGAEETAEVLERMLPPGILDPDEAPQQTEPEPDPEQTLKMQGMQLSNENKDLDAQKKQLDLADREEDEGAKVAEIAHHAIRGASGMGQ